MPMMLLIVSLLASRLLPKSRIKGNDNLFGHWRRHGLWFASWTGQADGDLLYWLWLRDQPHLSGVTVFHTGECLVRLLPIAG